MLAVLVGWNLVANRAAPEGFEILVAAVAVGLVVVIARRAGLGLQGAGLAKADVPRGIRVGLGAAGVVAGVLLLVAVVPAARDVFADGRFADVAGGEALYELLGRIPIATALAEEVAFRGVVLGMLLLWVTPRRAVVIASTLFGLWHVLPGLDALETASVDDAISGWQSGAIAVAGQVLITGIAGAGFCWLRIRGRHVLASSLPHWALNAVAYGIGWLAVQNGWT